ncbi:MAG: IS66 family transposase [Acidobacteria bacterium]|nr:IS66 family transposase [Acidobacteriota bacterium]
MSRTMHTKVIRAEGVIAYSHCPRKAFLLHCTEDRGIPNDYAHILEERASANRESYLANLQRTNTSTCSYNDRAFSSSIEVLTEANLEAANVTAYCDALRIVGQRGDPVAYEPTIVVGTYRLEKEQMLNLSVVGYVLGQLQNKPPAMGCLITLDGECHRVNLQPMYKIVGSILERIKGWYGDPPAQPPPVVLNKHCPYCPFKSVCSRQAEDADDLSLLDRMTSKAIRRYHSKGIFTVKQLSFLFKPRRRRRRRAAQPPRFDLEIQALAIRTGKIYIQTVPEIQKSDIELFLDIEGIPDQQVSYLIGLLVRARETLTQHAFWAETTEEEESIWRMFIEKAEEYPDAPIYHYGSYEVRAIESLAKRFGTDVKCLSKRLVNLNSQVYGKVYFPVRSNGLKVLGKFLGASWTAPDASGLQSLVWRYRWEMAGEAAYKQKLISYNAEDCQALRILTEKLARLRTDADSELDIDYVDRPKQNATRLGSELHTALDHVLLYASFDHPKGRISFRPQTDTAKRNGPGAPKGHQAYERTVPAGRRTVIQVASKRTCPKHKGERLQKKPGKDAEIVIVDLSFANTGCRKTVVKYAGEERYCQRCHRFYEPPIIKRLRGQTFGHGFRAWAVYQRIVLRLPYRVITQAMEELFHETASVASIVNFVESFAAYYRRTESILVKRLLESPFVHVDETRLSIDGVDQYVWVFSDGRHVVFRLTETRETAIVREILRGYQGVVVSDFYAGYDALDCRQQKCWVHLIRDLNEDLWKFPFDEELQGFVSGVKDLIVPIIEAIDRWGLKARHLRRFKKQVDRFYETVIEGREYGLDVTKTYQKRFVRYRESLFRFLDEDGIPWNNNTGERAIRHLAVQRKISGRLYQRGAVDYLVLLGIAQTCRFQEKSFLKFLLSKEIDVDRFRSAKRIKISKPINRVPQL